MPVEPSHSPESHESVSELVRLQPAMLTDCLKAARRGETESYSKKRDVHIIIAQKKSIQPHLLYNRCSLLMMDN